ncbi:MAG: substrate-binding domain-containing protein, partial [Gammaproteobacteria bacterium]|nr:substrate-binding domain-containing protein [Gammaproteobacteria bacterium]
MRGARRASIRPCLAAIAFAAAAPLAAAATTAEAPMAELRCAGADTMQALLDRLGAGYAEAHPHSRLRLRVDRSIRLSTEGLVAMFAGHADCVSLARELFPAEIAAYEAVYGLRPRPVPIARGSFATLHATHAIAIYVNAANPLRRLSLPALAHLLGAGPAAPAQRWGELGLSGAWREAPIHVYGMIPYRASGNPPGIVNFLRTRLLRGAELRADLRVVAPQPGVAPLAGIVARVAADPDGIGYSGFGFARPGTRALALSVGEAAPAWPGTPRNVADGRYPLARRIYLLLAPTPAGRDEAARRFLRYALGAAGQALVPDDALHFLPLTLAERRQAIAALARPDPIAAAARLTRGLEPYRPAPVPESAAAGERCADGSVRIVGYNDLRTPLAAIDLLFEATHPGVHFSLDLRGTRTAPPALASGRSLLAPMGAAFEPAALAAYRRAVGADPLRIRIAHDALDPRARSSPLGVFVSQGNPLRRITTQQLAAVFAPPAGAGAAADPRWGALGLQGLWQDRPIHLYGLAPGTAIGRFLQQRLFERRALAPGVREFAESRAVIAHAARDPDALAIADLNQRDPRLAALALARCASCAASRG